MTREDLETVYGLKQTTDGYNNGWTGGRNMNGSFYPKGEGAQHYTKVEYSKNYLQDYKPADLNDSDSYSNKNQYKG